MARITIKDLTQGVELDRSAMRAVSGGAQSRGRPAPVDASAPRGLRLVDYPPGFARATPAERPRSTK